MSRAQHGRQPLAFERQRGAQALARARGVEPVVERRRVDRAVRCRPLHLTVRRREVDGADDPAIREGVAVAVLEVRDRLVTEVGDEGNRPRVRAKWRPGEGEAAAGTAERLANGGAPRAVVRRVVELVEDDERVARQTAEDSGARGDLLVRGDDPVHVARQPARTRRPHRVEMQRERSRGPRPLHLQMRRRRDHDQPAAAARQLVPRGGQGERRLAGARRRDGEEIGCGRLDELVEGALLPGPEADGTGHRDGGR